MHITCLCVMHIADNIKFILVAEAGRSVEELVPVGHDARQQPLGLVYIHICVYIYIYIHIYIYIYIHTYSDPQGSLAHGANVGVPHQPNAANRLHACTSTQVNSGLTCQTLDPLFHIECLEAQCSIPNGLLSASCSPR